MPTPSRELPDADLLDPRRPGARDAYERFADAVNREAFDWLFERALRRPIQPETYLESRARFFGPAGEPAAIPASGTRAEDVLRTFRERVAPMTFNAQHPGAFSYFTPPPLAMSVGGEVLAQWLQQGVDVWHAGPAGAFVEEEIASWLCELVGLPRGWAVLTSGGVMANLMALAVAREIHLGALLGAAPRGAALEGARVYASDQTHFSVARGLDVLGFPADTLRVVGSDARFRLRTTDVEDAIAADRAAGLVPFAISAVAGSTNTGSVDDVVGLAALARRERLWLHVDAAYGGGARLSARDAPRVPGLELADSITIDPHKWFFQAYDVGALVVARRDDLHTTFRRAPEYYTSNRPVDEPLNWYEYSIEGTRRFRALKLWMSWQHLGTDGLGALVEHTVDLAAALASRIAAAEDFDLACEPELSVVCFRHVPPGSSSWTTEARNRYQRALQRALEVDGTAWVSVTTLRDATYLRAGIVNHIATLGEIEALLNAIRRRSEGVLEDLDRC